MTKKDDIETEAYLARIRRTIAESNRLVEQAGLRIAETDRFLASQGLTREQVMGFRFTDEQRDMVNRELVRNGMEPLEEEGTGVSGQWSGGSGQWSGVSGQRSEEVSDELAERQRKFGMMMKPFQI